MALAEPVYDPKDDKPVTKPNLRVIPGGGESTPAKNDHLMSVGSSPTSGGGLKKAEQAADSFHPSTSANPAGEMLQLSDTIGEGFKNASSGGIARFVTKKRAAGGGIVAGLVVGGIALFSISSGPLQFIHIAQLLDRFHFASLEDDGDSRTLAFYKYVKNAKGGTLENTRLGIVGTRIANSVDGKLSNIGIQKNYTKGFSAQYEGITIDQEKFAENAKGGDEFKGLSNEEFKAKFEEKFKVTLNTAPDGSTVAATEDIGGFFKNRSFNGLLIEEAGFSKISGAVATRTITQRDGITWHPIKKADAKVAGKIDEKFTAWLEKVKERIKNGDPQALKATGATTDEATKKDLSKEESSKNQGGADSTSKLADDAADITKSADDITPDKLPSSTSDVGAGAISRLTESTAGKAGLGATAVVGVACAAKGIAKAADGLKHDLVVLPLIRTAMQAISLGGQVMNGKDVDLTQLSFYNKQLTDSKGRSWTSARSMQAEQGQPLTGPDIPEAANISKIQSGNMFTQIFESIPGLGPVCDVAESTLGSLALTVVGAVTAPIATIGQTIVAQSGVLNGVIGSLVRWIAGSPIPTIVAGPDYGNYLNYGARLASNDAMAAMGGSALSVAQSAELKDFQRQTQQDNLAKQSFAQRVFDPYSPDSLVAIAIDSKPSNTNAYTASLFSNLVHPTKLFSSIFGTFSHRALAATSTYDYGFPEVGFSLEEMNSPDFADPYTNAKKALEILKGSSGEDYISRANKCFGVTISKDGSITESSGTLDITKKDFYSSDNGCTDASTNWKRIRFYILDNKIASAADCFDSGSDDSCGNVGFGGNQTQSSTSTASGGIVGDIGESSDSVPCASGTNDLGTVPSKYTGQAKKTAGPLIIHLCQIPDISGAGEDTAGKPTSGGVVVNSRVSGAWAAAGKQAKTDNAPLSATSSFRLNDSCGGNGDGTLCATPGSSYHQLGVAIDFDMPHVKGGTSCANRARQPDNKMWAWLFANAQKFGFKQYSYESWHWDPANLPNRCGNP